MRLGFLRWWSPSNRRVEKGCVGFSISRPAATDTKLQKTFSESKGRRLSCSPDSNKANWIPTVNERGNTRAAAPSNNRNWQANNQHCWNESICKECWITKSFETWSTSFRKNSLTNKLRKLLKTFVKTKKKKKRSSEKNDKLTFLKKWLNNEKWQKWLAHHPKTH